MEEDYYAIKRRGSDRVRKYRNELERKKTPRALYELIENQGKQQIALLEKLIELIGGKEDGI